MTKSKSIIPVFCVGSGWAQNSVDYIVGSIEKANALAYPGDLKLKPNSVGRTTKRVNKRHIAFLDGAWRFVNVSSLDNILEPELRRRPGNRDSPDVPMSEDEFHTLDTGDVVRSIHGHEGYVVHSNYGKRVTAACIFDITNPSEWVLVKKAHYNHDRTEVQPADTTSTESEVQPD